MRVAQPNRTTSFGVYDLAGELTARELDPGSPNTPSGSNQETLSYDATGNLLTHTDRDNRLTSDTYDNDNRLSQVIDSQGPISQTTTLSYDKDANVLSEALTAGGATTTYTTTYDFADQL